MAIITRRYTMHGPTDADLAAAVNPTAEVAREGSDFIDIQIDDAAVVDVVPTLDDYMQRRGWELADPNLADPASEIVIYSPDGTAWAVRVDNAGALSTTAI